MDIFYLEQDNRARVAESACIPTVYSIYNREFYLDAPEKACFFTGLPSVEILDVVLNSPNRTYTLQSDAVVSDSPTNELLFQGHRISTTLILVECVEIAPCNN